MAFNFYPSRTSGNLGKGGLFERLLEEGSVTHDPEIVGYVQSGDQQTGYAYTDGDQMEASYWQDGMIVYNAHIHHLEDGEAWAVPVRINQAGTIVETGPQSNRVTEDGYVTFIMENVQWDHANISDTDRFGILHMSEPTNGQHIIGWVVADNNVYAETPFTSVIENEGGSTTDIHVSPEGRGRPYGDEFIIKEGGSTALISVLTEGNGYPEELSHDDRHLGHFLDFGSKPPAGESWRYFWKQVAEGEGDWQEGKQYFVGNTVVIDGQAYECVTQHFAYEAGVYENYNFGDRPEDNEYFHMMYNDGYPALRKTIEGVWWIDIPEEIIYIDGRSSVILEPPYNIFVKSGGIWLNAVAYGKYAGLFNNSNVFLKVEGSWQQRQ